MEEKKEEVRTKGVEPEETEKKEAEEEPEEPEEAENAPSSFYKSAKSLSGNE